MDVPCFSVSDAGQAHEALGSKTIRAVVDPLPHRAQAEFKTRTLSVLRATSVQGVLGGRIGVRQWDRTICLVSSLKRAVEGFLGFRLFVFSGVALAQLPGIPIGGPLSGSAPLPRVPVRSPPAA
eukprot:2279981-Pyramimonas_sp.AAC.1